MKTVSLFLPLVLALGIPALAQDPVPEPPVPQAAKVTIPDVRGLEYRTATLANPGPRSPWAEVGKNDVTTGHFWILTRKNAGNPQGIGWDGVIYDLKSVGEKASWREDAERGLQPHKAGEPYIRLLAWEFAPRPVARFYLQQLGAPELATQIPPPIEMIGGFGPGFDTPKVDPLLRAWLANLGDAGRLAFSRQQFDVAKRLFETMRASTPTNNSLLGVKNYMLDEIERRQHDTPRPTEEVAGLIWDIQNTRVTDPGSLENTAWETSPELQKLIAIGDRAVDPLINALEKDERLTLSLSSTRSGGPFGSLGTVREAALYALRAILHHFYIPNYNIPAEQTQTALIAEIRADWEQIKGQSPAERIVVILAKRGQNLQRLEEAATYLEQVKVDAHPMSVTRRIIAPGLLEELLARRNPSVSDLLMERINEFSERAEKRDTTEQDVLGRTITPEVYIHTANKLIMTLWQWDAPRALPLMGPQLERTKKFRGGDKAAYPRIDFLQARRKTPYQTAAMQEYGQWVASFPFGSLSESSYDPLWRYPDDLELQKVLQTLFAAPQSPFQAAAQRPERGSSAQGAFRLLWSPLVRFPIVQEAIERELQNQTVVAQLVHPANTWERALGRIEVLAWKNGFAGSLPLNHPLENGDSQPLRVADLVGFSLRKKAPPATGHAFDHLLDVSLPQKERDAEPQKIIELVRKGEVATR